MSDVATRTSRRESNQADIHNNTKNRIRILFEYSHLNSDTQLHDTLERTVLGFLRDPAAQIVSSNVHDPNTNPRPEQQEAVSRKVWLNSGRFAGAPHDEKLMANKSFPLPYFPHYLDEVCDFELPWNYYAKIDTEQDPEPWHKIAKNRVVGASLPKSNVRKHSCLCTDECDERCLNRAMYYECDDYNCNVGGGKCGNRAFQELPESISKPRANQRVQVFPTATRGFAARALRDYDPGTLIIEYIGEVITKDECMRRVNNNYKGKTNFYIIDFDGGRTIDAMKYGSEARFINHSVQAPIIIHIAFKSVD